MDSLKKFLDLMADVVAKAIGPILARLDAIEKRQPEKGEPGKSLSMEDLLAWAVPRMDEWEAAAEAKAQDAIAAAAAAVPVPKDGQSVTVDQVSGLLKGLFDSWAREADARVTAAVSKAVADIPKPKDGIDGKDADISPLRGELTELCEKMEATGFAHIERVATKLVADAVAAIPKPKDGRDGADAAQVDVEKIKAQLVEYCAGLAADGRTALDNTLAAAIEALPTPKDGVDGKDAEPVDVTAIKAELRTDVAQHVATLTEWAHEEVPTLVAEAVSALPAPKDGVDGKDAAPADEAAIEAHIVARCEKWFGDAQRQNFEAIKEIAATAVAALPQPKDGVDGKDAEPVDVAAISAHVLGYCEEMGKAMNASALKSIAEAIAALPVPKDGVDGKSADPVEVEARLQKLFLEWAPVITREMKAHAAKLFAELPVPKDGINGKDGDSVTLDDVSTWLDANFSKWALGAERAFNEKTERAIAAMPKPKDGRDAVAAKDIELIDGRILRYTFADGTTKDMVTSLQAYRGVFKEGTDYQLNDTVTYGGSMWIGLKAEGLKSKPDAQGNESWRLCVKKGSDGRDLR